MHALLDAEHPDEIQKAQIETDHVSRAFAEIDRDGNFDVVHDHTGHVALSMADRVATPFVHTLHGPFDEAACAFYAAHGQKALLVALSEHQRSGAPEAAGEIAVVPNPLRVEEWPFGAEKEDFVLWIGRMSPDKGPHRAIAAARAAGVPLVLAGPVQPGQEAYFAEEIEPHVDGASVRYAGEADADAKRELYAAARGLLDADPLARAVRPRDGGGDGLRHAGDRVPGGRGAGAGDRRRDRLPGRRRGRDGGRDRPAR